VEHKGDTVTVAFPSFSVSLSHLPPVVLHFELPKKYPSEAPPEMRLECKWMNERQVRID
jgi:hypothetical protein